MRSAAATLGVALGLAAAACSREPQDPVERLLAAVERAVEQRDPAAVASHLAADFRGRNALDRRAAEAELRRYFAFYEDVDLHRAPAESVRDAGATLVTVRLLLSGKPKFEGRFGLRAGSSAPYRFTLRCREQDGRLLVVEADWVEEQPGEVAP